MIGKHNHRQAEAFRALEPRLCDIKHMASIASHEICEERGIDEQTAFAVYHLQKMIDLLYADYMATYREGNQ